MATLCLTRTVGTLNLGVYLRIKTEGTVYTVEPFCRHA